MLLFLIGVGFGPTPTMTSVAVQNVVERHHLGIAFGTMNFARNLFSTIMVAILGALELNVLPFPWEPALPVPAGYALLARMPKAPVAEFSPDETCKSM